jgi:hypothetical protein
MAKACGNWWKPPALISGLACQQAFRPGGKRSQINNYSFNKQGYGIWCLKSFLSLVVVMNVVELWKAPQPPDTR